MPKLSEIADKLDDLVDNGCMIQLGRSSPSPIGAVFVDETKLVWVRVWAEDQHHAHGIPYDSVDIVHDRDVAFYDKSKDIIAYVAPIEEWPGVNPLSQREHLATWQEYLQHKDNAISFDQFFAAQIRTWERTISRGLVQAIE